ncbi:MAG: hypothetical protein ACE15C_07250 [Phycisphaerae bacterium]
MFKWIKWGALGLGVLTVVGLLAFGSDLFSYVSSSAHAVRKAVKDSVPVEFELRRAHDLLEQIIPEMQANVRLIAQEEVEVANLQTDIQQSDAALAAEKTRIQKLSAMLETPQVSYYISGRDYPREQVKDDLAGRFDRFKEAQQILDGKRSLLANRQKSLAAAVASLDKTRATKTLLESKIAGLEGQYRMVQAASAGSEFKLDNTKIAQTEKLIAQIKTRLDVAQRVLAHEARFVQPIPVETITDKDLLTQVKDYFNPDKPAEGAVDKTAAAPSESCRASDGPVEKPQ